MKINVKHLFIIAFAQLIKGYWKTNPLVLYAQAAHETGNFTSSIFRENKNYFGMKESKSGADETTYEVGTSRGHAKYTSLWHAVFDYFGRQNYFKIPKLKAEEYMHKTQESGYAEDKAYVRKWLEVYKSIKGDSIKALVLYGLIPFSILIAIAWKIYKHFSITSKNYVATNRKKSS